MLKKPLITFLILITIFMVFTMVTLSGSKNGVEIETVRANKGSISTRISASGRVDSRTKSDVAAPSGGIIKTLPFADGSSVNKNAVILKLDEGMSTSLLRAPISGILSYNHNVNQGLWLSVGAGVQRGQVLFTIYDLSAMNFLANADEADIVKVKVGQEAEVELDAFPDQTIKGKVVKIGLVSEILSTGSTVFAVEIELEKSTLGLKVGMNGHADILDSKKRDIVKVPEEAVTTKENENRDVVFVLKDGIAYEKTVELGISDDIDVEILKGLEAGEEVITTGNDKLENGVKIKNGKTVKKTFLDMFFG